MTVTAEQVRQQLELIEPDYVAAAALGPEALSVLEQIASDPADQLAAGAVYLASLIGGQRAARLLLKAAHSPDAGVRFQAAAAAANLSGPEAEEVLLEVLSDADFGVRNAAVKSVRALSEKSAISDSIREKLSSLAQSDPEPFIKTASTALSADLQS